MNSCFLSVSLGACQSYQTVSVDNQGKLPRDVVHEVGRRRRRTLQLFPSCSSQTFSFSEPVTHKTSLYSLLLPSFSGLWQINVAHFGQKDEPKADMWMKTKRGTTGKQTQLRKEKTQTQRKTKALPLIMWCDATLTKHRPLQTHFWSRFNVRKHLRIIMCPLVAALNEAK